MSQILENCKLVTKDARELAYLGRYPEAMLKFKQQIDIVNTQLAKYQNDSMLYPEWSGLLNTLKDELDLTYNMYNYSRGNQLTLPASPQKPRSQECPEFHEEPRQPRLPFGQIPFQHAKRQDSPPRANQFQVSPPKQPKDDDAFFAGLRNGENKPKKVDRDPDVWADPPSKPTQKKKPVQKAAPRQSNPFRPEQNNANCGNNLNANGNANNNANKKRDYQKPWLKNAQVKKADGEEGGRKSFHDHVYPDGRGPDSDLIQMLESNVLDLNPNISFDDIAELDSAKEILQEAVIWPLMMPHLFTGIRRPVKGVLLFGPPGTGKTMLAKAVATTGKTTFFNVSAATLASKWKGESEKLVKLLFEMAKYYSPSTIFFDEIDALGSKRGDNDGDATRKVKTEMLIQMDGVCGGAVGEERKLIMCLGATNRPWDLDEALIRRLERRIYIPLPSATGRKEMFKINLSNMTLGQIDWDLLANKCEGYSGTDIKIVCREASMLPVRRKLKEEGGLQKFQEKYGDVQNLPNIPLEQKDFEEAIKNVNKSVTNEFLKEYEKWMKDFGTAGI